MYNFKRVYNAEGYAENPGSPVYYYYRKDHLGNNREVWQAPPSGGGGAGTTVQRTQYYPSGLPWAEGLGADVQNKKYNGKEFVEMSGYDMYDYGARFYYPASPVLSTPDPLCEKYHSISPYSYCAGNPVNAIDPDGLTYYFNTEGKFIGQYGETDDVMVLEINSYRLDYKSHVLYYSEKSATTMTFNDGSSMNYKEFNDLAGTLFSEATKGLKGSWQESAAIYSTLENRANDEGNNTWDQAQIGGVAGWSNRKEIFDKTANKNDVLNAYKGLIRGSLDKYDYSNGATYWDGDDYNKRVRYTQGTVFTKDSHNIWNLPNNAHAGKNDYGSWNSKYETTNALGLTTFSRLTKEYLNSRCKPGTKVYYSGSNKKTNK